MVNTNQTVKEVLAGTIAGITGTIIGHPLDTIKLHLQSSPGVHRGILDCTQFIFKRHGLIGFLRGITSPMVNLTILNSISFGCLGQCNDLISSYNYQNDPIIKFCQPYIAGGGVGLMSSFISTPFEFIKIKLQTSTTNQYHGTISACRRLSLKYGTQVIYTGHFINTIRELLFCAIYFGSYQNLKIYLIPKLADISLFQVNQVAISMAGGIAGMLGWIISYPLDVLKTMKQSEPLRPHSFKQGRSCFTLARLRFKRYGFGGFYSGIKTSLIRAFFVSATRFSAYEMVINTWDQFTSFSTVVE